MSDNSKEESSTFLITKKEIKKKNHNLISIKEEKDED